LLRDEATDGDGIEFEAVGAPKSVAEAVEDAIISDQSEADSVEETVSDDEAETNVEEALPEMESEDGSSYDDIAVEGELSVDAEQSHEDKPIEKDAPSQINPAMIFSQLTAASRHSLSSRQPPAASCWNAKRKCMISKPNRMNFY